MANKMTLTNEQMLLFKNLASKFQYEGKYYYYLPYWFRIGEGGEADVLNLDGLDEPFREALRGERKVSYKYDTDGKS